MILIINISNSNNLNKFWVGIFRVTSIKFTKQELGSQSVSQWVTDKHNQWSDSGPIKKRRRAFLSSSNTRKVQWIQLQGIWKSSLHCSHTSSACPVEKRSKGIFFSAVLRHNWDWAYHNSFSFCFWPKQWHFFLQVGASPFHLRFASSSRGVGLSWSFIFFSCLKIQMFSLSAWFW